MRIKSLALAFATAVAGLAVTASPASAEPKFQLPFPCGQTWNGDNDNSSAHRAHEIDFNRGSTGGADEGDTVLAAAGGTVTISSHQGSTNNFGNLVKIDHGGGWYTYYAHLRVRSVSEGQQVEQGQKIGEVGHTSAPGNNITAHLHYEVRVNGTWPGNIRPAYFDGVRFGYPNQNVTSRNSCEGNPYGVTDVCKGAGYKVIDTAQLPGSAGSVHLLYDASTRRNCVATLKKTSLGTAGPTSAYLEVQGSARQTDQGDYTFYAGPVSAVADAKCVKWGGSVGDAKYDSEFEHCD
ncbi:M23 family metallopeptidase [Saccharothrix australiensis]|uniref:Peptidase M23-like protein n=1 Tax=Saccharothrix australiensis TaxID=2072 RepID=A0A495W495_9PSEU|nr:M23 family metallopeptidase [Saccharothrix australiensis]RKT55483.1 peptidase M23-like protein [Saccharothrix australiensis]